MSARKKLNDDTFKRKLTFTQNRALSLKVGISRSDLELDGRRESSLNRYKEDIKKKNNLYKVRFKEISKSDSNIPSAEYR